MTGYLGLNMLLTLLRVSGAFAVVTITTMRKALTIAVSFLAFAKPFSMQYVWSGSLVVIGVYWSVLSKQKTGWDWRKDYWVTKIRQSVLRFLRLALNRWHKAKSTFHLKADDEQLDGVTISPCTAANFRRRKVSSLDCTDGVRIAGCATEEEGKISSSIRNPSGSKKMRSAGRSLSGGELSSRALNNLRIQRRMKRILDRILKEAGFSHALELSSRSADNQEALLGSLDSACATKRPIDVNKMLIRLQKAKYPAHSRRLI